MLRKLKAKILGLNDQGHEVPDPTPIAIPAGISRPPTLQETIQKFIRNDAIQRALAAEGLETFEEADDFEVGEDYEPSSPYELVFDPDLNKEVYPHEKNLIDAERKKFDEYTKQKKADAKKAAIKKNKEKAAKADSSKKDSPDTSGE